MLLLLLPGFFVGWNSQNFEFYTSVWFKVEFFLLVTKVAYGKIINIERIVNKIWAAYSDFYVDRLPMILHTKNQSKKTLSFNERKTDGARKFCDSNWLRAVECITLPLVMSVVR